MILSGAYTEIKNQRLNVKMFVFHLTFVELLHGVRQLLLLLLVWKYLVHDTVLFYVNLLSSITAWIDLMH